MRFLRILPAVWAMISCPFSSFTRNVALGRSSLTVPGNSSSSSLAIMPLGAFLGAEIAPKARKSKGKGPSIGRPVHRKARLYAGLQFVAHGAVGVQPLFAGAFEGRRVLRR